MPSISDLLNTSPGAGSMSPRRAGNLPPLSDLFGITPEVINAAPQRMRNIPPPPVKPKWDIRSGLPEPGLEQVTPEEWLPPGVGMKLAALAKGGIAPLAAGIMKNRGGVWAENSFPYHLHKDVIPPLPHETLRKILGSLSPEQVAELRRNNPWLRAFSEDPTTNDPRMAYDAIKKHLKDPSYLPHLQMDPDIASLKWARGPLRNYVIRDMATEGDPIRALAEQGITHLPDKYTKRLPNISGRRTPLDRVDQGFPAEETASTKLGKIWERLADVSVSPGPKNAHGDPIYRYSQTGISPSLDNHLPDLTKIIREGIKRGMIDPGSVSRGNFTLESAVRYADKIRKDVAKNKTSLDVFKEYPETGHKWVQLNKPGQFADESDAMGHSVRGYEPPELSLGGNLDYGGGGFPAIESGKAKIFSLRTPAGKPAVTAEVLQNLDGTYRISQIRGHSNSPPKPEYQGMIEDFRKSFEQR